MSKKKIGLLVVLSLFLISIGWLLTPRLLNGIMRQMLMKQLKIDSNICLPTKSAGCAESGGLLDTMTESTLSPKALNGLQMPSPYPLNNKKKTDDMKSG